MSNYWESRDARLTKKSEEIEELSQQLIRMGCTVYTSKKGTRKYTPFIKVFMLEKHVLIGFEEVPYRWYAELSLKPSHEHGSSRTIDERAEHTVYTAQEVLALMQPYPFATNTEFLDKQLFYLERIR